MTVIGFVFELMITDRYSEVLFKQGFFFVVLFFGFEFYTEFTRTHTHTHTHLSLIHI